MFLFIRAIEISLQGFTRIKKHNRFWQNNITDLLCKNRKAVQSRHDIACPTDSIDLIGLQWILYLHFQNNVRSLFIKWRCKGRLPPSVITLILILLSAYLENRSHSQFSVSKTRIAGYIYVSALDGFTSKRRTSLHSDAMNREGVSVLLTTLFSSLLLLCVLALLCFFTCRLASRVLPVGAPLRFWQSMWMRLKSW